MGHALCEDFRQCNEPATIGLLHRSFVLQNLRFFYRGWLTLVTLFGLGCIILVYKIGKELYGKQTGLFAAVLFALSPWQLIFSRTFIIDVQSMFLSLLCLFMGILAIRQGSVKLTLVSGLLFAAAFMTKFFAVYVLIPLLLLYVCYTPKNPRRILGQLASYSLPVLFFAFLWYQVILGKGLLSIFQHNDFAELNVDGVIPSYFFVANFVVGYGLGWFFVDAAVLSLIIGLVKSGLFRKLLAFDIACFTTIGSILSVNLFLGATLNLRAPYTDTFKFSYQSLPFFSLLAASLARKSILLFESAKSSKKLTKLFFFFVASLGLFLLAAATLYNMYCVHLFSTWDYLLFRVALNVNLGYSLFNPSPIDNFSFWMGLQYLGFAFVLSGLIWVSRHRLSKLQSMVFRQIAIENQSCP
jgi:4-amino-4-deoxy-L-arabinose transferase-like glycosyltransferase